MADKLKNMIIDNQRMYKINTRLVHIQNSSTEEETTNKKSKNKTKIIKKMNKQTNFMAIAKGRESVESTEIKRYIGIAACNIVAINPSKEEIKKLYGRPNEKDVNYLGEADVNGVKVPQARIDIYYKLGTDKAGNAIYKDSDGKPLENIFRKSIFMTKTPMTNRDNTKVKVVDKYGNTAWVTKEEFASHTVPTYSNGPASISKDYRPLYRGEETVMNIIKAFLHIPDIRVENEIPMEYDWNTKQWVKATHPEDGEIRFDAPEKFFDGDFKEISEIPSYQPMNKVAILIGIRNVDGKMYQDVYDEVARINLRAGISSIIATANITKLEKSLNEAKANGRYGNTEFHICEFQEYTVTPTNFNNTTTAVEDPFASTDDIF